MTNTSHDLLAGLRVLELGHYVAAPFATRLLADLGADVIKIEPKEGDPVRQWGEQVDGHSLWWSLHGRNKRSVAMNLKNSHAKDIVLKLVGHCDALVENFRPGQLAKLGLGPEMLRQARPDLVIAHVSGFGQTGPYRDRAAFGVIGEAMGGLRYLTDHAPGVSNLPPVRVGVSIGDSVAGLYAAFGVMAALWRRDRCGSDCKSQTLDVALTESILSLMEGMLPEYGAMGKVKQPTGGGIATAAPTNAYPTQDGKWVLIAANSDPLFAKLARLLGRPDLILSPSYAGNQARVENMRELDCLIAQWTSSVPAGILLDLLNDADIPSSRVFTAADCAADPQYRDRGMVQEVIDPAFRFPVLHPGIVPRVVGDEAQIRWAGPSVGAHTTEVLAGLLGFTDEQIEDYRKEGII